jgi:hypothetical protein
MPGCCPGGAGWSGGGPASIGACQNWHHLFPGLTRSVGEVSIPSGAEAPLILWSLTYGLKLVPFTLTVPFKTEC